MWLVYYWFCCFKQKTAYYMRISDWSSDVCSSDLYSNITGISRFRIVGELPLKDGYRRVVADYSAFDGDLHEASETIDRDRLIGALTAYLTSNDLGADWSTVAALRPEPLVNTLAMTDRKSTV